ncbi:hypothetical protein C2845_PM04G26630 [Panicum miliaceum]|uniref:Uncharacterized protein n=1 Tax=Panicum miliaceum TaxID=4540 RepID=A0A3L6QMV7_PANMI|nr:hypothetical protein C2845_PM04G26630 [Panicum miliaceum]
MNGPAASVTDLQRGESALCDCNRGTQTRQLSSGGGGRGTALPKRAPLMAQGEVSQRRHARRRDGELKDLVPAATNTVNTTFIVFDKAAPAARPPHPHPHAQARGGEEVTCLALVADDTAAAHFLLWGGECGAFEPGDIVRLTGGIFSYHRGNALVLRAGRRGRAEKVGEFTMLFVETPNMSEVQWGRDPGDPRRMVQEAVVSPYSQVFKPLR